MASRKKIKKPAASLKAGNAARIRDLKASIRELERKKKPSNWRARVMNLKLRIAKLAGEKAK